MKSPKFSRAAAIAFAGAVLAWQIALPSLANDPYQLNAQTNSYGGGAAAPGYTYPSPVAVPQQAIPPQVNFAPPQQPMYQPPQPPPQHRAPIQLGVQKNVALPKGYMGTWRVSGNRTKVEAMRPEFEATAQTAFAPNTTNMWTIQGDQQSGYTMGNGEMQCQFFVDKIGPDGTAFIRYSHQIGKTEAQEAVIMTLTNGGRSFNGLERISIVKPGEQGPRCKVTYALAGQRVH